jgi:hypothetical protein
MATINVAPNDDENNDQGVEGGRSAKTMLPRYVFLWQLRQKLVLILLIPRFEQ